MEESDARIPGSTSTPTEHALIKRNLHIEENSRRPIKKHKVINTHLGELSGEPNISEVKCLDESLVIQHHSLNTKSAENSSPKGKKSPTKQNQTKRSVTPDLFDEDSTDMESDEEMYTWAGTCLSAFNTLSPSNLNVPPLTVSSNHEIHVRLPLRERDMPEPYPRSYVDIWDANHVRMPNSPESLYPIQKPDGTSELVNRWQLIYDSLHKDINSVAELQAAILAYNQRYESKWKFEGLKQLIEEVFEEEEQEFFFKTLLPKIVKLALSLPSIVTTPPTLLTQKTTGSISLSQQQIASLLANAFFSTFPRRNARGPFTEYSTYNDINFNRLFRHKESRSLEKIKCIINYFREVLAREPDGIVTFTRQYISPSDMPDFEVCSNPLPRFHIDTRGLIEETPGLLQVDFANKYIGGGVLGLGCVQEEIRFVLCPELLVSMLFTEVLDKHEALIITGVEQYNEGIGYASSFEWVASYQDVTLRDPYKRRLCQVVGMDALHFARNRAQQYKPDLITREIQKAYAGFHVLDGSPGKPAAIASGNWGCGAFRGDPKLKGLIQMAAAGAAGRDLAYFTFGDKKLRNSLVEMHQFLVDNSVTVGQLVMVLCQYGLCRKNVDGLDLYKYIRHSIGGSYSSDTDSGGGESCQPGSSYQCRESSQNSTETSKFQKKPGKTIVDYFKVVLKGDTTAGRSRTSNNPSSSSTNPSSSRSSDGATRNKPLSDEKIAEALSECDKLVRSKPDRQSGGPVVSGYMDKNIEGTVNNGANTNDAPGCSGLFSRLNKYDEKLK